jgi:monoamine oxidase
VSDLDGPLTHVVVVGAGIAGLGAAATLRAAQVPCTVLEARDRIGGRLHTVDLGGASVDLGGSWIHHPDGNPVLDLADELGVAHRPGDPLPTLSGYDAVEHRLLGRDEVDAVLDLAHEAFGQALPGLREKLGDDAPAMGAVVAFAAAATPPGAAHDRLVQALRAEVEADASDAAERHSLRWWGNEDEYGGDFFGELPVGGYRAVVERLARGLDVRLGTEVVEVNATPAGVAVRDASGHVHEGSHAVVTVPLGVLQAGVVRFDPPLDGDRTNAVAGLGFGRYEKVLLGFSEAWWRGSGPSHLVLFPEDRDAPALWVFDHDAFLGDPVLECHAFHSATPHVLDDPAGAVAWMTDQLAPAYGDRVRRPAHTAVTSWAHDRFTRGGYSHVTPGRSPDDLDLLGTPHAGRILFAGEHTQSARVGFADGALSSGLREAERLLSLRF